VPEQREPEDLTLIDDEACRKFVAGIELAGRRWSSSILLAAARGATRYSEYYRMIDGISQRLIPTTPVQVHYHLSSRGKELMDSLTPLVRWGQKWDPDSPPHRPGGDATVETP
jgi:DNA-binding HxlR family transcriptional regulator